MVVYSFEKYDFHRFCFIVFYHSLFFGALLALKCRPSVRSIIRCGPFCRPKFRWNQSGSVLVAADKVSCSRNNGRLCTLPFVSKKILDRRNNTHLIVSSCTRIFPTNFLRQQETRTVPDWFQTQSNGINERERLAGYVLQRGTVIIFWLPHGSATIPRVSGGAPIFFTTAGNNLQLLVLAYPRVVYLGLLCPRITVQEEEHEDEEDGAKMSPAISFTFFVFLFSDVV